MRVKVLSHGYIANNIMLLKYVEHSMAIKVSIEPVRLSFIISVTTKDPGTQKVKIISSTLKIIMP